MGVAIAVLLCLRFAHVHLLWADEDYHLAAAIQILHGKLPYRDFWYDKPPLSAVFYLLIAGRAGWPLRMLDTAYLALACYLAYRLARAWWSEAEGVIAALLLAFFMTFYLPAAVIPFAPDSLMLAPHLAAMYCAQRKLAVWAGVWAGVAFLVNTKALFVLAACAVWLWPTLPPLLAGFAIPTFSAAGAAIWSGAWPAYLEQVWRWGFLYGANSPLAHPIQSGISRTLNWLAFHAALAAGAIFGWLRLSRSDRFRLSVWAAFSFAAVCLGSRFLPRYFIQLLPSIVIVAARGTVLAWRAHRKAAAIVFPLLLLLPLLRFGPRYISLAYDDLTNRDPHWQDVAMDLDSQDVARQIHAMARPGDTLFVWGYRPDIYVYTRLIAPGVLWDSQPLTGVPADRHLSVTKPIYAGAAAAQREQLIRSSPTWIADGLSLLNPKLSPESYSELQPWLANYKLIARTKLSLIYRRK